jgi:hypothetical protein
VINPVKAKIVASATDYCRSSLHAHLACHDPLEIINPQKLIGRDFKNKKPSQKREIN